MTSTTSLVVPPAIDMARGRSLVFDRVRVMGIVNVTPDSFSDGGRFVARAPAVAHALRLVADGAHLVDIGGESTRPGSEAVSPAEQIRRVVPVIADLRAHDAEVAISVDTTSAAVAAAALDAGADLVNDVSAFRWDPEMLPLIAARGVPAIAMHTLGRPDTMQTAPRYDDVVAEVIAHLGQRVESCRMAGIAPERLIVDPGIGFGKTLAHNLALIRALPRLIAALGRPVLVGTSRKTFLGLITGRPVDDRERATAASCAAAIALGAHIVRVHDVGGLADTVRVADAIARGHGG